MPELTQLIPIFSLLIAALALYRNVKGDTKTDAGRLTEIIVKLETINENVKDVKTDMKDMKMDFEKVKERLVVVEQSVKSAHKRIDSLHDEHEAES